VSRTVVEKFIRPNPTRWKKT